MANAMQHNDKNRPKIYVERGMSHTIPEFWSHITVICLNTIASTRQYCGTNWIGFWKTHWFRLDQVI